MPEIVQAALLDAMQTTTLASHRPRYRPARWRPQVRLRTMMAAITVLCILLGSQVNRVHREQGAIRTLTGQGINVVVATSAPEWLPDALDGAWLQHVLAVNTGRRGWKSASPEEWPERHSPATPISMIEIFFCVNPTQQSGPRLHSPIVTEELLPTVAALHDCKVLLLDGSPISDAGLKDLRRLSRLQYLDLRDTRITDAAIADLTQLRRLERLNLRGTQVSDDGLARLRRALPDCSINR